MKRLIAVALALAWVTGGVQAHHSRAPFDLSQDRVLKVKITHDLWEGQPIERVSGVVAL